MTDLNEIRTKLQLLKKYDTSFAAFGSKEHQYTSHPVLSESDLADFEQRERVTLPKSYRAYLKHVGNGGAGPAYGIYSLDDARNGAGWHPPVKDLNASPENENSPGELLLSHNGCGLFTWLRITGPAAGQVGDDSCRSINPDFLDWYTTWIDSIFLETGFITHLSNEAMTLGMQGDVEEALDLFKIAVNIKCHDRFTVAPAVKEEYLKIFCNVLYFLQQDNTGLPVNVELNQFFLEKALVHGPENPAIYFNAACVYNEMKEFDNVLKCIALAEQHYDEYDMMMEVIEEAELFSEFREQTAFF